MAEEPNVGGASSRDELPFKRVSFDSEAARKRKPKSLKQIMEQMGTRYGADTSYQTFNWASVLAAPSVRPRHKYCDITGLLVGLAEGGREREQSLLTNMIYGPSLCSLPRHPMLIQRRACDTIMQPFISTLRR